jgi:acyl dehydratase
MYFEEFEVGQQIVTQGRTITEADIVGFAGLSGDYNQIHTDVRFAQGTPFGRRIAHGLLVLSIVSGLAVQTGFMEGTIIAFREISQWKFTRPVFIGDTVHAVLELTGTRPLRRLGGGAIEISLKVINQDGETVMSGSWTALIASAPEE